jgi:YD repeat-containing protein
VDQYWETNIHQGRVVRIVSGPGENQEKRILSNTGNRLTTEEFDPAPGEDSEYEIRYAERRVNTTAYDSSGNVLSETRQQGASPNPTFVTTSYVYDSLNRRTVTRCGWCRPSKHVSVR